MSFSRSRRNRRRAGSKHGSEVLAERFTRGTPNLNRPLTSESVGVVGLDVANARTAGSRRGRKDQGTLREAASREQNRTSALSTTRRDRARGGKPEKRLRNDTGAGVTIPLVDSVGWHVLEKKKERKHYRAPQASAEYKTCGELFKCRSVNV